jgi:transcriptional regulator NrdR family protein
VIACRKCDEKLKCISTRANSIGVTRRYACQRCDIRLSTLEQVLVPQMTGTKPSRPEAPACA